MTEILFPLVNAPEDVIKEPKLEQDISKSASAGFIVNNNGVLSSIVKGNKEEGLPKDAQGIPLDANGKRMDILDKLRHDLWSDRKGNPSGYNGFENPKIKALPEEDRLAWASQIAHTENEDDVNWVHNNIRLQNESKKVAAQTFRDTDFTANLGYGLGSLAGLTLDPLNWAPIGYATKLSKLSIGVGAARVEKVAEVAQLTKTGVKSAAVVAGSVAASTTIGDDAYNLTPEEQLTYTALGGAAGGALGFGLGIMYNRSLAKEVESIYLSRAQEAKTIDNPIQEQVATLKTYVPPRYADIQENVDLTEAKVSIQGKFKVTPEIQTTIKQTEEALAKGDEFFVNGERSTNAKEIVIKGVQGENAVTVRKLEDEGGYISLSGVSDAFKARFAKAKPTAVDPIEEMRLFEPTGKIKPKAANSWVGQLIFDATYEGILKLTSPASRLMNSGFDTLAQWSKNTYGTPVLFEGLDNSKLTPPVIHEMQRLQHNSTIKFEKSLEKHYSNFVAKNGKKLDIDQFTEEYHKLVHAGENSAYPQVKEFADDVKKTVTEPWLKELEEVGLIEPGAIKLGDGEYYFHRDWDIDKMTLNKAEAIIDLENMFSKGKLKNIEIELKELAEKLGVQSKEYKDLKAYLDSGAASQDAKITAANFYDDVAGDRINYSTFRDDGKFSNRTTKYRLADVDSKMVYKWLNNKDVVSQFGRMNREHVFDYVGTKNGWRQLGANVQKEYEGNIQLINDRIATLKKMSTPENKSKVDSSIAKLEETKAKYLEHYKESKKDFEGLWNRLRGRDFYGNVKGGVGHQVVRGLQTATALSVGHNMAYSTIPEILTIARKYVATKWGKRHAKFIAELGRTIKDANLSKETLEAFAIRIDALSDFGRQNTINGTSDVLGLQGKAGRVISKVNDVVYIANFMRAITNWSKGVSAELAANELIEKALIGVTKADDNYLQRLGLNKADIKSFNKQIIESGSENPTGWKDVKVRDKFMSAVREKVHGDYVIEAHGGGKPGVSDTLVGRVVTQFKTFMLRAAEAYVARSAQEFSLEEALKMMTRITGGMLSYYLRSLTRMNSDDIDTSPQRLAYEGFMNGGPISGYDQVLRTVSLAARKYNVPALDPTRWFGIEDERIQARMNQDLVTGTLLGASAAIYNHAEKFGKATANLSQGNGSLSDYSFLVSYAPILGSPLVQKQISLLTND
jgi:hypothetical protein